VGCLVAKLGTRRGCRPGESAHPSKRRRSLRECSAARQEAVSGGGAGRSVRPFAGAHVGPSRGHSKRHGLLRSSAGVRLVVPGSGVRSASLSTTLPCSGRAPAVCQHESEIHDFHSSPGATARAAEGTVRPPMTTGMRHRLEFRISTLFLGVAAVALIAAFAIDELGSRLPIPRSEPLIGILLWVIFPCTAAIGAVAAAVFLIWKRRWQFVFEVVVGAAFIAYLLRWETP
jgi:hypothetical protein